MRLKASVSYTTPSANLRENLLQSHDAQRCMTGTRRVPVSNRGFKEGRKKIGKGKKGKGKKKEGKKRKAKGRKREKREKQGKREKSQKGNEKRKEKGGKKGRKRNLNISNGTE